MQPTEFVFERDISPQTKQQIYQLAQDYTGEYFTPDFAHDMLTDMAFQSAASLQAQGRVLCAIVFTSLEGSLHISLMVTARPCARQGYGALLLGQFVSFASTRGYHSLELLTFAPQAKPAYAATVAFYQKEGFYIAREYDDLWPSGATLKMRKEWP